MKNICIFFGGKSCEHDISIITAMQVQANINRDKYNVFPIYINNKGEWLYTKKLTEPKQFENIGKKFPKVFFTAGDNTLFQKGKFGIKRLARIDCAILANHGMNGEDGTLQGLLELCNVPYSSSNHCSSAVNMDKVFMKQIFEVNNMPITNYYWFTKQKYAKNSDKIIKEIQKIIEFPMIIKPANLGSSIGITKANSVQELENSIQTALHYDNKILVEEVVQHLVEINCACLGYAPDIMVSELDQPVSWTQFLDFDQKYLNFTNTKFEKSKKVDIPTEIIAKIKKMSKFAFEKLDCSGVVRIDYLFNTDTDELYINEINTIPGSFSHFMFPKLTFTELIDKLIYFAEVKFAQKNACEFTYDSQVLKKYSKDKGKFSK